MEPGEHARTRPSDSGDPLVGRVLERRYRIERRIARGGMAGVYEATDVRLDRTVAVKVMHHGMGDDDEFAARFVREARSAARLSHPNVVSVYDQGDDDGTVYLAMELVSGHTLRDVIRKESPMTPLRALALLEPVLSALAAAHRAGIVHRDVKPENVLISDASSGGQVKVADFGLAKAVSAATQHTATGVLIGTVSYLAPEVVVHGRADERADVYAAGVILYELLTGAKPHDGESQIQVAYKAVHEDVPPPSARVPDVPAYVDALVARATARDHDQRPADAGVLLHQVHRVAQALREGVADDPELEADLRPLQTAGPLEVEESADEDGLVDVEESWADHLFRDEPGGSDADDAHHTRQIQPLAAAAAAGSGAGARAAGGMSGHAAATRPGELRRLPAPSADAPAPGRPRGRRSRGPLVLVLALLLVAGVGVGAWWFGSARYTNTPGLLGMQEAEAVATLEAAGLEARVGEPAYSETVPVGAVLETEPAPGERVLDGGTVTLVLSRGQERYEVPDLAGATVDEAQDALAATNLTYGRLVERFHDTVPAGVVLGTDPPKGTVLKPAATVNVVVSLGRKPVELRSWTGKDADRAEAALERKGLVVTREEVYDDEVAEGLVVSQDPAAGTLYKGDAVTLVVSQGPELVEVPNVVAQGVDAATQALQELGFVVETQDADNSLGLGFVFSTDPGAGESVPKGSTITLYLI